MDSVWKAVTVALFALFSSGVVGQEEEMLSSETSRATRLPLEEQRIRDEERMQDERDAHRERAESRERDLQERIQQRRDDIMKDMNKTP